MDLYVVFPKDPPEEWLGIPGVKAVGAGEFGSVEGEFAVVMGDCELAERRQVASCRRRRPRSF